MKKILLLLLFLILGTSLNKTYAQASGIVKKVAGTFTKKEASELAAKELEREAIKKFGKNFTEKELRKLALEKTGKNFAERAVAEQFIKRAAREQVTKVIEKEGLTSFLEYGNKMASKEIAETGLSATKKDMFRLAAKDGYNQRLLNTRKGIAYIEKTMTRIRVGSKNQFLTKAQYLKRIKSNPKIIKGKPKDGQILRENMLSMMTPKEKAFVLNKMKNGNQAHHIIGNKTPIAAKKLKEFGIDINDPMNGIFLPSSTESGLKGTVHAGGHTSDYYDEIERLFANCKSKEQCYELLDKVKNDLYKGKIKLYSDGVNKVNKVFTSTKKAA